MNSVTLDELKDIERHIKKELITEYNSFIPKEKADLWLSNNYFNKSNYNSNKSLLKYQGELLRYLFSQIINIEIANNVESKNLQEGFVEYYVEDFANKNGIEISERPDLKNKIKMAFEMANKLGKKTNKLVFTSNYNELKREVNSLINNDAKPIINEKVNPSLMLIYENGEQFIKYIDGNKEIHLVKSANPKKVSKLYEQLSNKNTDIKEMFNKLINIFEDEQEKVFSEEINMLDFIPSRNNGNDEIKLDEKVINDVISDITFNESKEINDEKDITSNYKQIIEDYNNSEKAEYSETIEKNNLDESNNEEFISLKNIEKQSNDLILNNNLEVFDNHTQEIKENKKDNIYMLFYIFAIIISVALIIGIIVLKYFN